MQCALALLKQPRRLCSYKQEAGNTKKRWMLQLWYTILQTSYIMLTLSYCSICRWIAKRKIYIILPVRYCWFYCCCQHGHSSITYLSSLLVYFATTFLCSSLKTRFHVFTRAKNVRCNRFAEITAQRELKLALSHNAEIIHDLIWTYNMQHKIL